MLTEVPEIRFCAMANTELGRYSWYFSGLKDRLMLNEE